MPAFRTTNSSHCTVRCPWLSSGLERTSGVRGRKPLHRASRACAAAGANLTPPGCCVVMERCAGSLFQRVHVASADLDRRQVVSLAKQVHETARRLAIARPCATRRETASRPPSQVAEGLAYLHSRSPPVVHRDIKSHNVLLSAGDFGLVAKICDFGLVPSKAARRPNWRAKRGALRCGSPGVAPHAWLSRGAVAVADVPPAA